MCSTNRSTKVPVSVLIPTRNEEVHIFACVRSVLWADDIVVVDSNSSDRTTELAFSLGARAVNFEYEPGGPKKKNWALANVDFRNSWVLVLDADERITSRLEDEIAAAIADPGDKVGYYINRRFYFCNGWIRHCGYYPSWNMRLFRRDCARYEMFVAVDTKSGDNEVHEHVILTGPAGQLHSPMDHYAYLSIDQFLEKHIRYSNWEAMLGRQATTDLPSAGSSTFVGEINRKRRMKTLARAFPCVHWLRFFYHFVWQRGFLDGTRGYILCHLLAEYEFQIWAKTFERKVVPAR